jgi:hypothetical protein
MRYTLLVMTLALILWHRPATAQLINSGTGVVNSADSFGEFIGGSGGMRGKNWFFGFGGGAPGGGAVPPFGGVPGGLTGGFGFGGGGLSGGFGFTAGQGYSSSLGSTSGSITSLNGTPGFIFNGTLTPFVTEITPVVGGRTPVLISPLALKLQQAGGVQGLRPPLRLPERQHAESGGDQREAVRESGNGLTGSKKSSAERGDLSVAAIRRQQAAEDAALEAELKEFITEADRLAASGDHRGAALQYSKAAAKVEGDRREAFLVKARELRAR